LLHEAVVRAVSLAVLTSVSSISLCFHSSESTDDLYLGVQLSIEEGPGLSKWWFKHESLVLHLDLHGGHLDDLSVLLGVI